MTGRASTGDARAREEKRALIALSLVPGVASGRVRQLVRSFGTAERVLTQPVDRLSRVPGIGPQTASAIASFRAEAPSAVEDQVRRAVRIGAKMITADDPRFPFLLGKIYDPPAFVWMRGRLPPTSNPEQSISIVGTRKPTEYGRRTARLLASRLATLGFTIVSGLAYGIDACAHRGALEAGGRTIAVLGSGLDRVYPPKHTRLARAVIERGATISEFAMGAKPDAGNFPRRNRVISGLSLGTIVVEAYDEGGALITARLALEQNREVFAVPGPITSKASTGTNRLIQCGYAKLVQSVDDVLEEIAPEMSGGVKAAGSGKLFDEMLDLSELAPEERALCRVLDTEARHIDRVCVDAGLDPSTALAHLLTLEFKGVVRQMAGMQFYLAKPINDA